MSLEQRHLHLRGALGHARDEVWDGRPHLVVPTVALVGDLAIHAVNAKHPELVPLSLLSESPSKWDNFPIMRGHPVDKNGRQCSANDKAIIASHGLGTIRNARIENKKLCLDAYVDVAKAEALGEQKLLERLRSGQMVECSIGAFVHTRDEVGESNGRKYLSVWSSLQPDHIAILSHEGARGACSINDMCGVNRAAQMHLVTAKGLSLESPMTSLKDRILSFFRALKADTGEAEAEHLAWSLAFGDEQDIRTAVGARHSSGDVTRIQEVHDAAVSLGAKCGSETKTIDQLMAEGALLAMAAVPGESKKTDCPTCGGSGNAKGNPCETCDGSGELKVAEGHCSCGSKAAEGVVSMEKKERIAALMSNEHNPVKDLTDKTSDEVLTVLEANATANAAAAAKHKVELKAAQDETSRLKALAECKTCKGEGKAFGKECADCGGTGELKAAELVTSLKAAREAQIPTDELAAMRTLMAERKAKDAADHADLIGKLKTATVGIFTEDELKAKSLGDLRALARVAKIDEPRIDRSPLMPQPRHAQGVDQFAPPNPYPSLVKKEA